MRQSWTEREGRAAVEGWRASGETLKGYAARIGVGEAKLQYWRAKVNAGERMTTAMGLVAVRVKRKAVVIGKGEAPGESAPAEVRVATDGVVAIQRAHAVDPAWVAALARALALATT